MTNIIMQNNLLYVFIYYFFCIICAVFRWRYSVSIMSLVRMRSLFNSFRSCLQPYSRRDFCSTSTKCEWTYAVCAVRGSIFRPAVISTNVARVTQHFLWSYPFSTESKKSHPNCLFLTREHRHTQTRHPTLPPHITTCWTMLFLWGPF